MHLISNNIPLSITGRILKNDAVLQNRFSELHLQHDRFCKSEGFFRESGGFFWRSGRLL